MIYLVSGKLGSGKTLISVARIRDALLEGRRVATNLDLYLEGLLPRRWKTASCLRLPDKPCVDNLHALGCGNDSRDEDMNGLIVLDELASWLNARTFQDKGRMAVIDWLLHSRKHGWDVIFICQHIDQIDKQIRTALVEYLVTCRRMDRLKIPFVGRLLRTLSAGYLKGNMPQVHVATVRYGVDVNAIVADRWVYRGKDLYGGYETRQVFVEDPGQAVYSYLPPWHLGGYALPSRRDVVRQWVEACLLDRHAAAARLERVRLRKAKLAWVERLATLPPDDAIAAWRRLQSCGRTGGAVGNG